MKQDHYIISHDYPKTVCSVKQSVELPIRERQEGEKRKIKAAIKAIRHTPPSSFPAGLVQASCDCKVLVNVVKVVPITETWERRYKPYLINKYYMEKLCLIISHLKICILILTFFKDFIKQHVY